MRKTAVTILVALFCLPAILPAQSAEADEAYIKAMTATSPAERAQLLKDYIGKFAGKGSKYENFAYANLSMSPYPGKTARETIDYGEKALALGGLDDMTQAQLLIQLSAIYGEQGQNIEKAKSLAHRVIELAKAAKAKESDPAAANQWNMLVGAGTFALGQASEKGKDLKGALDAYLGSYAILKNPQILASIKKLGKALYDAKAYGEAERAFKLAYQTSKDFDSIAFYAKSLYRNNQKDEALVLFKEAYAKQKSGEIAFNIGIILAGSAKTNSSLSGEAIRYLLEASMLSPTNAQQAMSLAESLYFTSNKDLKYNENVQQIEAVGQKIEALTKTYNSKVEGKDEEDLDEAAKKELKSLLAQIEAEKKTLDKLQKEQELVVAQFSKLIEETKLRLGAK
jgi:tetratricopeptide (TPR) repeat protein